jgi:hypothetical protein
MNALNFDRSTFTVSNKPTGDMITVTCLASPKSQPRAAWASCFFQIRSVPALVEIAYSASDRGKQGYFDAAKAMIAEARLK